MDQQAFESFVNENIDLLKGARPETNDDLDRYGKELGFRLPQSVKWLLATHGYSMACGIENLEDSVKTTSECRKTISLPSNIFIINDWNDGGVVFAIVEEMRQVDTTGVVPMAHPIDAMPLADLATAAPSATNGMALRLRDDVVNEANQREANQRSAPAVERGLFLVPKVIE